MEHLNHTLFALLNAKPHPDAMILATATFWAEYFILVILIGAAAAWLRTAWPSREALLRAVLAAVAVIALNQLIALAWQHPRPFMVGEGHTLLAHVADSSFPSDHLSVIWAVAFSLLRHRPFRRAGLALAALGVPVAWARIYLGVHYPLDMAGAALASLACAWLIARVPQQATAGLYRLAIALHRRLFAPFIARGWVLA